MSEQVLLCAGKNYIELDKYLKENNIKSIFLLCEDYVADLGIGKYFESIESRMDIQVVKFSDFTPNPLYESVVKGVKCFIEAGSDMIIAVGGGSAMDVVKCIKLYSNMNHEKNYLTQAIVPNNVRFAAVPTTAGTGSEGTRYAVIYYKGKKQSVADYSCIPDMVLMDADTLITLPIYQKKATMLDALCHAIESYWSVNSTEESRQYSAEAIEMILSAKAGYLANDIVGNECMLRAANIAGKAINITQTTAGHAMCYKLTSLYGISHGHAVALCVSKLWSYMLKHTDKCIDPRGEEYMANIFKEIEKHISIEQFNGILEELDIKAPKVKNERDFDILKISVNLVIIKNNPIELDEETINALYHKILAR